MVALLSSQPPKVAATEASGTALPPFSLKEMYAKDKLNLIPKRGEVVALNEYMARKGLAYKVKEEVLQIGVDNSLAAIPILNEAEPMLEGFEAVQGSMDDVFLNVTGRKLEG